MNVIRNIWKTSLVILVGITLVACGNQSEEERGQQVVNVGTMGTYEPFSFYDEDDLLTGYDIEVLRAAEAYMPNVTFEFQSGPWDTLFPGLDADTYQLLANQLTSNSDREAKYEITTESYFYDITQPIVRADNTTIASLADLAGKTVGVTVGDSHTRALEEYNEAHGGTITIKYYEADITSVLEDLVNGRIDATVNNPIMAKRKADTLGLQIKVIDDTLTKAPAVFVMKKGEAGETLRKQLDEALTKMKEDGTLSKLSKAWFGSDYTK